jgi:mannonate dehydratase
MVYGHANGTSLEDTVERAREYKALGYKAIRLQSGVPGLAST